MKDVDLTNFPLNQSTRLSDIVLEMDYHNTERFEESDLSKMTLEELKGYKTKIKKEQDELLDEIENHGEKSFVVKERIEEISKLIDKVDDCIENLTRDRD